MGWNLHFQNEQHQMFVSFLPVFWSQNWLTCKVPEPPFTRILHQECNGCPGDLTQECCVHSLCPHDFGHVDTRPKQDHLIMQFKSYNTNYTMLYKHGTGNFLGHVYLHWHFSFLHFGSVLITHWFYLWLLDIRRL